MGAPKAGGGWRAVWYTWKKAQEAGGLWKMYSALRTKNACKTCALGMGGQKGGMVNEIGGFPEVCKKSLQAMAADMQPAIAPQFWRENGIAKLQQMTPRELERCGRLVQPVIHRLGKSGYEPISWDDAFQRVADKLQALTADETFWYFSGRSSNEAGFLLQLFARIYGTNNVNNCSYYCHQASGVGLSSSIGSGTATIVLEDVEHADLVFVIGGNPPSNHPRLMTTLMHIRRNGGKVVVVNPVVETGLVRFSVPSNVRSLLFGDEIASQYVQPHIGGDLALLTGIAKAVDARGAAEETFLKEHCNGYETWIAAVRNTGWDEIETKSGVARDEIESVAETYVQAKNVVFSWTMGVTHHAHGVQTCRRLPTSR